MGRKKLNRDVPLYIRLKEDNNDYVNTLCIKAGTSKTAWIDRHFDFLRKNVPLRKAAKMIERASNGSEKRN